MTGGGARRQVGGLNYPDAHTGVVRGWEEGSSSFPPPSSLPSLLPLLSLPPSHPRRPSQLRLVPATHDAAHGRATQATPASRRTRRLPVKVRPAVLMAGLALSRPLFPPRRLCRRPRRTSGDLGGEQPSSRETSRNFELEPGVEGGRETSHCYRAQQLSHGRVARVSRARRRVSPLPPAADR